MDGDIPPGMRQDLRCAQLILVSLKRDHEQALDVLNALSSSQGSTGVGKLESDAESIKPFNQEKIPLIKAALNRIQDGLDESEVLLTFANYMDCLEAEITKLRLHNQRLCEETCWLRDELKHTQGKLLKSESLLAQVVSEKQHLEFINDLKKLDNVDEKRESFHRGFAGCESAFPSNRLMSVSITDPQAASRHSAALFTPIRPGISKHRDDVPHAMACSQTADVSSLMNSSMVDADLNMWSCTQSFHPSLLGTNEHKVTGPSTIPPSLRTLHRIVVQYTSQGKHDVAAALCMQAIDDLERTGGRDQAEVAVLLNILALVYRDQGKYNEASEMLKNVVSIRERLFGSNNPLVAASLNNLAVLYAKAGRFDDAEPLCRRALAIREKLFGPNHLDVAKQLNNLALLCQSQGRFEEVESCLRRALDVYMKLYKPSSPIVLRAKNNLASALLKSGKLIDSEALLKSVLSPTHSGASLAMLNGQSVSSPVNAADVDSAVFSVDGSCFSGFPGHDCSTNDQSSPRNPVPPLWLIVEQASKEGRAQLSRLTKFDLASWASEACIDISIVLSAIRNLSIIYQRQGQIVQANLLRSWVQLTTVNRTCTPRSATSLSPDMPRPIIPNDLKTSACLPCSSPHSDSYERLDGEKTNS